MSELLERKRQLLLKKHAILKEKKRRHDLAGQTIAKEWNALMEDFQRVNMMKKER